jgi:predicted glutamine amidotransferase
MCELFALSARRPADVHLSLEEFSRRGGLAGPHKDGWGVAWYDGVDVRLVKEPAAASDSACLAFLQDRPFRSGLVVSHIRKATQGANTLANTQPFARELGGRMHVFAHNGDLDGARLRAAWRLGAWRPLGDTDSEYAFCALLARLAPLWGEGARPPLAARRERVAEFAQALRALGPANFLYADGDALFVHGHRRTHADGIRPPGLHVLSRSCAGERGRFDAEGLSIESAGGPQEVALVASVPLTPGEPWRPLAEGELLALREGRVVEPGATDRH